MTEAEWLAATDPRPKLDFISSKTSDRKLRLLAVACCRQVWHLLTDARNRTAVEMAEVYADGGITDEVLMSYHMEAYPVYETLHGYELSAARGAAFTAWCFVDDPLAAESAFFATDNSIRELADIPEQPLVNLALLRDIIGNPFRPAAFDPSWRTEAVVALARGMYESRDFGPMPVLADALDDAGCGDADILAHCRGPGPHVRGCWVVDLVLGKS